MITLTGYADQHPIPRMVISGDDLDLIIRALDDSEDAETIGTLAKIERIVGTDYMVDAIRK